MGPCRWARGSPIAPRTRPPCRGGGGVTEEVGDSRNRLKQDTLKGVEPQQEEESLEKDELATKKK